MDTGPAQVVTTEVALDAGNDALLAHLLERYRFPEGYRRMFLAAIATFSERGFHGTSTRDIAALRLSRPSQAMRVAQGWSDYSWRSGVA